MRISTRSSKLALRQVDIFLNNLNAESLVPEIKKTNNFRRYKKPER